MATIDRPFPHWLIQKELAATLGIKPQRVHELLTHVSEGCYNERTLKLRAATVRWHGHRFTDPLWGAYRVTLPPRHSRRKPPEQTGAVIQNNRLYIVPAVPEPLAPNPSPLPGEAP